MKGLKYHEMGNPELEVEVRERESELWKLRFQAATGQTEGLRKIRTLKRNIARVRTILREREILAERTEGGQANG